MKSDGRNADRMDSIHIVFKRFVWIVNNKQIVNSVDIRHIIAVQTELLT